MTAAHREREGGERSGAYRWFYFDAVSPDGELALVAIFFVGSVFSPYYAKRLARGEEPKPSEHLAVNLALYRRGRRPRFVFSEYGAGGGGLELDERGGLVRMTVGKSSVVRDGSRFTVRIDDRCVGLRTPMVGTAVFDGLEESLPELALAPGHLWRAHLPRARVSARFGDFSLQDVLGYHDENRGHEPPVRAFARWSWGRVHERETTKVFFDLEARAPSRGGGIVREHLTIDARRGVSRTALPTRRLAPSWSSYLLPLPSAFDSGCSEQGERYLSSPVDVLERAPFYLRFLARFPPENALSMGEHVDFDRIDSRLVRKMVSLRVARPERGDYGILP